MFGHDAGVSQAEIDLAEGVLRQTEAAVAAVRVDQGDAPTPCSGFDVSQLVNHLVGWAGSFGARLSGGPAIGDPNDYRAGTYPAVEFHLAALAIIGAYRVAAPPSQQLPVGFIVVEFLTHGWDLTTATGQEVVFAPTAAELALQTARQMLKPEYRGPGKAFGPEVAVSSTADAVTQLVAFMGRDPDWQPTA